MSEFEHSPWVPDGYKLGLYGRRIAIVGYSHHGRPKDEDHSEFTRDVLQKVIRGENIPGNFFSKIQRYFGEDKSFWEKVLFFNFLPNQIGASDEKYKIGTKTDHERGRARFLKILLAEKPDCVFVFTTKGWSQCPKTTEEENGPCIPLSDNETGSWGTYDISGHRVFAVGLLHPQYSNKARMTKAIKEALAIHDIQFHVKKI